MCLRIRVRGKEISYHFLLESKSHKRIDLLIIASVNFILIVMKRCFSAGKLMEQFGTPPPFQLTPLFLSNFFMTHPLCPNFKNQKPTP